jgi:hypothetical protein
MGNVKQMESETTQRERESRRKKKTVKKETRETNTQTKINIVLLTNTYLIAAMLKLFLNKKANV